MGHDHSVTPNHGSRERLLMLRRRYRESRRSQKEAAAAGDGYESCRHKGEAERFKWLISQEYGENIDE